jgi:hypothetical protein
VWRYIYAFPIPFAVVNMILFTCSFEFDSLQHLIKRNKQEDALRFIKCLYVSDNDYLHNQILDEFTENVRYTERLRENNEPPGFISACFDPYYRRATWVAMALAFFSQASGVYSLNLYSSTILSLISSRGDVNINIKVATPCIGLA